MPINGKKIAIVSGIEFFIAIIFFVGADWTSDPVHLFFHAYFADIAIPFSFYFLLVMPEDNLSFLRMVVWMLPMSL